MNFFRWGTAGRAARTDSARASRSRKAVPGLESLEPIRLMAAGAPVVSGQVFLDENGASPNSANNGVLDPGEQGIAGASVELLDANHKVVATTTTAADGSYAFASTDGKAPVPNPAPVATPAQTLTVGDPAQNQLLTDFLNKPLAPALTLFDPSLGTLNSVTVKSSVSFKSNTTAQNLSPNAPATISPTLQGNYDLEGLTQAVKGTVNAPASSMTAPPFDPANPSASKVVFPPLSATNAPPAQTLSDPASLAFFTMSAGRTSISPTLAATSSGVGNLPNGNVTTTVVTSASAALTVSYAYTPPSNILKPGKYTIVQEPAVPDLIDGKESQGGVTVPPSLGPNQSLIVNLGTTDSPANDFAKLTVPPPPPTVASLARSGVHQQPTTLVLTFNGTVDPALARDAGRYTVIAINGRRIGVVSAAYNPATKTVTLTPAQRLNARSLFDLSVKLPARDGTTVDVPFGGAASFRALKASGGTSSVPSA